MGSEWPTVSLGELAADVPNALVGGPFGSNLLARDQVDSGVPVIQGSNMGKGRWLDGDFVFVSEEKADTLAANTARWGDIIFTQRGTVGQVALVPETYPRFVVSQSQMKLTPNTALADVRYLYYYFSAPAQIGHMRARAIQTGVPHTNLSILRDSPVALPPLDEQRRIASILGALDDKIELNRRMSRTLDEMAQAIFKSWLIDRSGDDWQDGKLGDVLEVVRVAVQPKHAVPPTPYVGLEHFDGGSTVLSRWGSAADVASGKSAFRRGDILFGKLRPYFHNVAVGPFDGICSTDVMVLRPKALEWLGYALGHVNSEEFISYATARSEGTRMPRAKWADVAAYTVRLPSAQALRGYQRLVIPKIERQLLLATQSRQLEQVRDALLSRLLSGEIRIDASSATGASGRCSPRI